MHRLTDDALDAFTERSAPQLGHVVARAAVSVGEVIAFRIAVRLLQHTVGFLFFFFFGILTYFVLHVACCFDGCGRGVMSTLIAAMSASVQVTAAA